MSDALASKRTVLVSSLLFALVVVYKDRTRGGGDTFRALWGAGVVGFVLSLVADFAPTIAGPFAVLVLLGSLTNGGGNLIETALGRAASTSHTNPATGKPAAPTTSPTGRPQAQPGTTPVGGPR